MAVRDNPSVAGEEFWLYVEKVADSGNYVAVACLTSFDFTVTGSQPQRGACRGGAVVVPAGTTDLPTLPFEGYIKVYASGDKATNVSAEEMTDWTNDKTIKNWRWGGTKTGDPLYEAPAFISGFTCKFPQEGLATYSGTLNLTEDYTKTYLGA